MAETSRKRRSEQRKVAAIAAVLEYIGAENAAGAAGVLPAGNRSAKRLSPDPWALYGRQQIMSMRSLLYRRAFRR